MNVSHWPSRGRFAGGLLLCGWLLTGCSSLRHSSAPPVASLSALPATNQIDLSSSRLRAGDTLVISFSDLPPPGLQPVTVELGPDGKIALPHGVAGYGLGKTPRQLEQELRAEYVPKTFLHLTISVRPEMRFYSVGGEVRMPAQYPYRAETSVIRAIQAAGWFTDYARRSKVQLTRANGQTFIVNCDEILKKPSTDPPVYPGDYVIVPMKKWWEW